MTYIQITVKTTWKNEEILDLIKSLESSINLNMETLGKIERIEIVSKNNTIKEVNGKRC
jgi:hypothetical protein